MGLSLFYDNLPDVFLAYDIWLVEEGRFLDADVVESLLSKTSIKYIKPIKMTFNSILDIVKYSEGQSSYRNGRKEGIVIRTNDNVFKVVNRFFERRDDFNLSDPIKNRIKSV